MAQVIARMFGSHDTALAAQKALQQRGLPANEIHVISGGSAPAPATPHDAVAADPDVQAVTEDWTPTEPGHQATPPADAGTTDRLARIGLPSEHLSTYAAGLRDGHALVTVRPPFGMAQLAINTLHEFDPLPLDIHETRPSEPPESVRAAPLSAKLGWRVLINDPEPLSRALGWKTLQPEPPTSKTSEQVRKLSSDAAPLSDAVKLPVLSGNAAPLSSAVNAPTLSDNPAPLSKAVNMPVLSDEAAPLSKKIGWRTLLDDPAPLSRLLGLPVLLKR